MKMSHGRDHEISNYSRAFAIGIILNVIFVVIEAICGVVAGSLALIADAGHNLSDVLSLLLAWGANLLASKQPTEKRTYGFRRVTILASLTSAILLLVALGSIAWEAFGRLSNPQSVEGMIIIVVAAIGVIINTVTALLFISGQKHDLNIKGAYPHMAADAGVSLGVVVAGIAIMITGWLWLDPVISLVIVIVILVGTWNLLRDSINLSVDAVPQGIDIYDIKSYLISIKNVSKIHDLHVWALSTMETALTVHLVTTNDLIDNDFLQEVQQYLYDNFGIEHATIQVEKEDAENSCMLNRPECIKKEENNMGNKEDKWVCAHCGYTASGKFVGDICPQCNQTYWKCPKCGFLITAAMPPDTCPSCSEKCDFRNVTCYTPECGGPGHVDPRL